MPIAADLPYEAGQVEAVTDGRPLILSRPDSLVLAGGAALWHGNCNRHHSNNEFKGRSYGIVLLLLSFLQHDPILTSMLLLYLSIAWLVGIACRLGS